jgi:predicted HTH transcriptional regulator
MTPPAPFDSAVCPNAQLPALSADRIWRFAKTAQTRGFPLTQNVPPRAILDHLHLVSNERPTNAALLLFCGEPQRYLPSSRIECEQFSADRDPIEKLTCEGTLFEMLDQAMYFVLSKLVLASAAPDAPAAYEIPVEAVREAITNAVAHRDYASGSCVRVTLYPDRLEVYNPGTLPPALSLAQLSAPHSSVPANPLVAEPLYFTGHRQGKGTGTTDMIALCRRAGLAKPVFALDGGFLVILSRLKAAAPRPVPPAPGQDIPPAKPPKPPKAPPPDHQVLTLLRLLEKTGPLGNSEILQHMGLKDRINLFKNYLAPALAAGLIERTIPDKPQSRSQKYRLTAKGKTILKHFPNL